MTSVAFESLLPLTECIQSACILTGVKKNARLLDFSLEFDLLKKMYNNYTKSR